MDTHIGKAIKSLRLSRQISQTDLAQALDVSTQAISKWENQKAMPDIMLLPAIARFFSISIDDLFSDPGLYQDVLPDEVSANLAINNLAWDGISEKNWRGTALPSWGVYIPNEEVLHLMDDIAGKKVLEIACGAGRSLVYCGEKNPKELWALDISNLQLQKAKTRLKEEGLSAHLFLSPMEVNPGIPEHYFDYVYSVYGIGWTQDLDKTISLIARYVKPGGCFIFSWDNPLLPCLDHVNGKYMLNRSYVQELKIQKIQRGEAVVLTNWKLSSYINLLSKYGFKIEQMIEDSIEIPPDAPFTGEYYSEHKARFIHHTFVIKARKL